MTIGEKIQHYRKLQGLSQEELGQKLLVSRQTISLWENDQTLPTIDNLIRLKDIFGVSLDELLCGQKEETDTPAPLEQYVFTYTADEVKQGQKIDRLQKGKRLLALSLVMLVICGLIFGEGAVASFLVGFVVMGAIVFTPILLRNRKLRQKNINAVIQRTYHYDVYEDHVFLRIFLGGNISSAYTIPFSEMKKLGETENLLHFVYDQKIHSLHKAQLLPSSHVYPALQDQRKASAKLITAANVLFWASLILAIAAVAWFFHLSLDMEFLVAQIWCCFLALPIPVACVVLGIVLKVKGDKGTKNVIAGVLTAALLLLFGSLSLYLENWDIHFSDPAPNPPYISTIEQYTGIDIPEHSSVHTTDFSDSPLIGAWTTHYISSTIFFDSAAVEDFEQAMKTDPRWISAVKNELIGILPHDGNVYISGQYVLIYNIDLAQWNQVPQKSGRYHMLFLLYDPEGNTMNASEYLLDYVQ